MVENQEIELAHSSGVYRSPSSLNLKLHATNATSQLQILRGFEMNTQTLNVRLTPLFDAHKQTLNLIHRLSKLPAQPGSSPLNPDAGDARVELSAEIHQSLKEQEEDFELIRQEFEDQTGSASWANSSRRRDSVRDKERSALAAQVTRLGEDLRS